MSKIYSSNCCGAEMSPSYRDMEICPDCKEHCEVEVEEVDDLVEQYGLQN